MDKLPFEYDEFKVLNKQEAETGSVYGVYPEKRSIKELLDFSFINLDKPDGPTSFKAADTVKRILRAKKSGHSGTLDPMVTGVLPVALGRATRLTALFLPAGKEYKGTMQIHGSVTREELDMVLEEFTGKITQLPPVRSRVKRVERDREVYYLDIESVNRKNVTFTVGCQAGTYIRKICHDIGERLGTGAHMTRLRRTRAGPFGVEEAVTLEQITEAVDCCRETQDESGLRKILIPAEKAVAHIPAIWVKDDWIGEITYGGWLYTDGICRFHDVIEAGDTVALLTLKGELAAFGRSWMSSDEIRESPNALVMKEKKVFLQRGIYQRMKKD